MSNSSQLNLNCISLSAYVWRLFMLKYPFKALFFHFLSRIFTRITTTIRLFIRSQKGAKSVTKSQSIRRPLAPSNNNHNEDDKTPRKVICFTQLSGFAFFFFLLYERLGVRFCDTAVFVGSQSYLSFKAHFYNELTHKTF